MAVTEALLAKAGDQVTAGRIKDTGKIGVRTGKIINRYKVAKHFIPDLGDPPRVCGFSVYAEYTSA